MPGITRRLWISGTLCVALLALTACGNSEADQRKAFTDFLQTRILDRKGARVPQLTEDNKTAFGEYAQHYAVITSFHEKMNASVGPGISKVLAAGSFMSIGQVVSRKDDIVTARQTMADLRRGLDTAIADAEKARAALKQPADLKLIYDKAFDKIVTQPATAFRDIWPAVDATFDDILKFADFLNANQSKIKINGPIAEVSDQKLLTQFNAQVASMQKHSGDIQQAQRKLREVMFGE
jgi:hypothetical protein